MGDSRAVGKQPLAHFTRLQQQHHSTTAPQHAKSLAFSSKVWRIMALRGIAPLSKFAVIRQFRAESVIEISWLRFRDSIALSMCF